MAEEKKTYEKVTFPKGIAVYPKLLEAHKFSERDKKSIPDPAGDFSVNIDYEESELPAGLLEKIDDMVEARLKEVKEDAIKKRIDPKKIDGLLPYKFLENGKLRFTFKASGQYVNNKQETVTNKITFFDTSSPKPQQIHPESVWGGSEIKLNATLFDYGNVGIKTAGVSLFINAVQIFKLVSGKDASDFGFESEEENQVSEDELIGEEELPF